MLFPWTEIPDLSSWLSHPKAAEWAEEYLSGVLGMQSAVPTSWLPPGMVKPTGPQHQWTPAKRRDTNIRALEMLRYVQTSATVTPEQKSFLKAYSGWGGVNVQTLKPHKAFPGNYNQGIRQLRDLSKGGSLPTQNVFSGLKDQYFTPVPICEAMAALAERVSLRSLHTAIDTASGIGRMADAAPDKRWTLVEPDPLLAQLLRAVYPEHTVVEKTFEEYAASTDDTVDFALINPPFGSWSPSGQALLPEWSGAGVRRLQTAAVLQTMRTVRMGGAIIVLAPIGMINGTSGENRMFRSNMLAECHFAGAAFPPHDMFSKLGAVLGLSVQVWIKGSVAWREKNPLTARDKAVWAGSYLESEEGLTNTLGAWGDYRGRPAVVGEMDPDAIAKMELHTLSRGDMKIKKARKARSKRKVADVSPEVFEGSMARAPSEITVVHEALAMSARVMRHFDLIRQDPQLAEEGREPLRKALLAYGSPVGVKELEAVRGKLTHLFSVFRSDGSLVSTLSAAQTSKASFARDLSTAWEVVQHYSGRRGYATDGDLVTHGFENAHAALVGNAQCGVFPTEGGDGWAYFTREAFGRGDLYPRLDRLNHYLPSAPKKLKAKYAIQREWLIEAIAPFGLGSIDLTPRSGFIPQATLQAYIDHLSPSGTKESLTLSYTQGVYQLLYAQGGAEYFRGGARGQLVGYLNREMSSMGKLKRTSRYTTKEIGERLAEDVRLEDDFRAWLSATDGHREAVEDAYNRAYRSRRVATKSTEPVYIARLSSMYTPNPHQVQFVNWQREVGSGILAHDVGAGKTFEALMDVAAHLQRGEITKALIVVPNSVIVNWYEETTRALPDFMVGVVGVTMTAKGMRSDAGKSDLRREKWVRFANGGYEILIVGYDAFTRDVWTRPETQVELFSELEQLQREIGMQEADRNLLKRKIAHAQGAVADAVAEGKEELERKRSLALEKLVETLEKGNARVSSSKIQQAIDAVDLRIASHNNYAPRGAKRLVWWEDLGVERLYVDEAHNFKNLFFPDSRMGAPKIKYMGAGSKTVIRAWSLWLKTQELLKRQQDRGVVLLTATPMKNSPLELYSMLSLCSRNVWRRRAIKSSEEFVDRHIMLEEQIVARVDGTLERGLAATGFKALDEIRDTLNEYVFYLSTDDLLARGMLKAVPMPKDSTPEIQMDSQQERIYSKLQEMGQDAVEELMGGDSDGADVNAGAWQLMLLDMMSKAALDPRILADDVFRVDLLVYRAYLNSKNPAPIPQESLNAAATVRSMKGPKPSLTPIRKMTDGKLANLLVRQAMLHALNLGSVRSWYAAHPQQPPPKYLYLADKINESPGCGHIVFSDYNKTHQFMVDAIVEMTDVPRERIAILDGSIKPSRRQEIAHGFNGTKGNPALGIEPTDPIYDVVIGHSGVMAEGLNLQTRTCAIHHITHPWEPGMVRQRNGRGVRQGNRFGSVDLIYYLAVGTLDVYRLNMIHGKAAWMGTLFAPGENSISNPFKDMEESQTALMIRIFVRDAEKADALIAELGEMRDALVAERKAKELRRNFDAVNAAFIRARANPDSGVYQDMALALLAKAKVAFQGSNGLPALLSAERGPTWLSRDTERYYTVGDCLLTGDSKSGGAPQNRIVITDVRGPFLGFRRHNTLRLTGLTGNDSQIRNYRKVSRAAWGAESAFAPGSTSLLRGEVRMQDWVRKTAFDVIPFREAFERGSPGLPEAEREFFPPYMTEDGLVVFEWRGARRSGRDYLSPWDREDWLKVLEAFSRATVRVEYPTGGYYSREWVQEHPREEDMAALKATMKVWFSRVLGRHSALPYTKITEWKRSVKKVAPEHVRSYAEAISKILPSNWVEKDGGFVDDSGVHRRPDRQAWKEALRRQRLYNR